FIGSRPIVGYYIDFDMEMISKYTKKLKGKEKNKNLDKKEVMQQIIAGMGVFIKSELANERVAVAVLTPSEEDEHSC
ncbi:hypothetical protein ACP0F4_25935, partial [Escherichia coli]|uniref:hypothetical protein n=1 Tax=Escherichia coli TaxID=562 RepID=UPI003CF987F0